MNEKVVTLILVIVLIYVVVAVGQATLDKIHGDNLKLGLEFCRAAGYEGIEYFLENYQCAYNGPKVCFNTTGQDCLCPSQLVVWFTGCGCPPVNTTVGWCP